MKCPRKCLTFWGHFRIPGYDKSEKFLRKARLYHTYKAQLQEKAVGHAKQLEIKRDEQDELFPQAQTVEFFEWYFEKGRFPPCYLHP